jgi:two-component system sensor histidine kinase GlrK
LKTPLANLREGSELLADGSAGELDTTQREIVQILRDNSVELQGLIENFLAFNSAGSRDAELQLDSVNLDAIVEDVLLQHQLETKRKKVKIDVRCLSTELWLDREKTRILLDNLLSNAIKFSPRGGRIEVSAREHSDYVVLDVKDQGPGVRDVDRDRIFKPFVQGRAPAESTVRGTGLGLSVAREYAELQGGSIEVKQTDTGKGACFRVLLPMTRAANAA